VPFRISHDLEGSKPTDTKRHFIPRDVMRAQFKLRYAPLFDLSEKIRSHYSMSKIIYFNAPPPICNERLLTAKPEPHFEEVIHRGFAPNQLRLELFNIQTEILAEHALKQGAIFLDSPNEAFDGDGFLSEQYCANDFTHANTAFGNLILKQLRNLLEG